MSMFSINKDTLESLISYFTNLQGTFDDNNQQVRSKLTELADNWNSNGSRRQSYGDIQQEYSAGFSKLTEATSEVLAFLRETLQRIEQAEE